MACEQNLPRMRYYKQIDPQKEYKSPEELAKAYLFLQENWIEGTHLAYEIFRQMHILRQEIHAQFVFDSREYQ
jgi:hypothetical protein